MRLASAYNAAGKYDEALPILDKLMAQPDLHPAIRQFAQAERVRSIQGKGGGAKPATPPPAARRSRSGPHSGPRGRKEALIATMRADLDALENCTAYRFRDREILHRALTHSSHVHEKSLVEKNDASAR